VTARVDHIGVVVSSLDAAGAFLRDALGLELKLEPSPTPEGVRIAFYGGEGARVEVIEIADPQAREARLGSAEARIEHIALEVEDVRAATLRLRARGVAFTTEEPFPVRDTLSIWTVPETSAGVAWQLFSRVAR
jgi:catechol 2,3-dioxygenase-like lactoylglutathione lyase family enzyme